MGRGRSSSGGSRGHSSFSSGSRGSSSFSSRGSSSFSSNRGNSTSSYRGTSSSSYDSGSHRTTVIIGGSNHYHHSGHTSAKTGYIMAAIVSLLFGIFMLSYFVSQIVYVNQYGAVDAVCINNERANGWYYTTYKYTVNDVEYRERSMEGWEFPETLEATVTIYYEKDNPKNIMESKPTLNDGSIVLGVIGTIITAVGVIFIVKAIKTKNADEQVSESADGQSVPTQTSNTYITCAYCGSKYKSDMDSCPKCGGR